MRLFQPTPPRLIAITGRKRSGKSSLTAVLNNLGYQTVKFAAPLKSMLSALGLSEAQIEGCEKEIPADILMGSTPRHAMQTLGTAWGRGLIHEDIWTNHWTLTARAILDSHGLVVCDDCRFPNEAVAVEHLGGLLIRVERKCTDAGFDNHISEQIEALPYDIFLKNSGTLEDLTTAMLWALKVDFYNSSPQPVQQQESST